LLLEFPWQTDPSDEILKVNIRHIQRCFQSEKYAIIKKKHKHNYPSIQMFILVGGKTTPLKNMTSSVGMMTFPTEWKVINVPNHQPDHHHIPVVCL
jgi:hypothetical protein